jgi:hypothetical protein
VIFSSDRWLEPEAVRMITAADVRDAADILRPVYQARRHRAVRLRPQVDRAAAPRALIMADEVGR